MNSRKCLQNKLMKRFPISLLLLNTKTILTFHVHSLTQFYYSPDFLVNCLQHLLIQFLFASSLCTTSFHSPSYLLQQLGMRIRPDLESHSSP